MPRGYAGFGSSIGNLRTSQNSGMRLLFWATSNTRQRPAITNPWVIQMASPGGSSRMAGALAAGGSLLPEHAHLVGQTE